jgi:hypothetical protein
MPSLRKFQIFVFLNSPFVDRPLLRKRGLARARKNRDFLASPSASFFEGSDLTEWGTKGSNEIRMKVFEEG